MPLPQSNVIFFYLFAAFFVFITQRGELPKYLGFLLSSPAPSGGSSASASSIVNVFGGSTNSNPIAGAVGPTSLGGAPLSTGDATAIGALY